MSPVKQTITSFRPTCLQVTLATEFLWNWNNREANAAVGYDYILRQCRLRGRILSAEIDHFTKNSRFGFGMAVGE
jgi:mitochondrial import receptor subunit TOM40